MAMRLFSREDFQKELRRAGLEPTDFVTQTGRLWETKDGQFISVPEHTDIYPDSVLEDLLRQVGRLYRPPEESD